MRRFFSGLVFVAALGVAVVACDSGDDDYVGGYGGGGGNGYCAQATTCGSCTPLDGCGWCFNSNGVGTCTSGPDQCSTPEFSWTWDPTGCRETADAGVTLGPDGGDAAAEASVGADGAASGDAAEAGVTP
jgi:hypothetical protein